MDINLKDHKNLPDNFNSAIFEEMGVEDVERILINIIKKHNIWLFDHLKEIANLDDKKRPIYVYELLVAINDLSIRYYNKEARQ